jgi:hypothetical protein
MDWRMMETPAILTVLDNEVTAHGRNIFSLGVVFAHENGEPRSDQLVFHNQADRRDKIYGLLGEGRECIGLLAIIRTRYGAVCGFRRFTEEPWAVRILHSGLLEMATLVSADRNFAIIPGSERIQ